MTPKTSFLRPVHLVLAGVALFAGCAGPSVRHYSLAEPARVQSVASATVRPGTGGPLYIELSPVAVPERLARVQMVVRRTGTEAPQVDVLDQDRWSSSFDNELRDALSAGIAARLGAIDASKSGRPAGASSVRIAVQVRRFDAQEGRGVSAAVSWTLRRGAQADVPQACRLDLDEPVAGGGIEALAAGAQRLTARLADAVADSAGAFQAGRTASCGAS